MTDLRNSQLASIAVEGGTAVLDASQLAAIAVLGNPAAAEMRVSQFFTVTVISNGKNYLPLGPVRPLPCWQPCTAHGTEAVVIRLR